jgi:hypothetical protein
MSRRALVAALIAGLLAIVGILAMRSALPFVMGQVKPWPVATCSTRMSILVAYIFIIMESPRALGWVQMSGALILLVASYQCACHPGRTRATLEVLCWLGLTCSLAITFWWLGLWFIEEAWKGGALLQDLICFGAIALISLAWLSVTRVLRSDRVRRVFAPSQHAA